MQAMHVELNHDDDAASLLLRNLRVACSVLLDTPEDLVTAVSITASNAREPGWILPVIAVAEGLARDSGLEVRSKLRKRSVTIRFTRKAAPAQRSRTRKESR
jgi:hypothetical protein